MPRARSRTPHGVRGLKLRANHWLTSDMLSHPSRGAWIEIGYQPRCSRFRSSHPSRGAWIEITSAWIRRSGIRSHPSRGAWIEIASMSSMLAHLRSHPSRGAWIEIRLTWLQAWPITSRTPHGVRGLKYRYNRRADAYGGRTPHGVRGLKYQR